MRNADSSESVTFVFVGYSIFIDGGLHDQSRSGGSARDQIDDGLMAEKWFAQPVLSNEAEDPVFNPVPFACSGREVSHQKAHPEFIGQIL